MGCRSIAWEPVPYFAAYFKYALLRNNMTHAVQVGSAAATGHTSLPTNAATWGCRAEADKVKTASHFRLWHTFMPQRVMFAKLRACARPHLYQALSPAVPFPCSAVLATCAVAREDSKQYHRRGAYHSGAQPRHLGHGWHWRQKY